MSVAAACVATVMPVAVEPVNATTSEAATSAEPTSGPGPVTTAQSSAGSPASMKAPRVARMLKAPWSSAFCSTALPAASAGAMSIAVRLGG